MESPPQYPGAPKKSNVGLILGIIALVIVLCCCGSCGFLGYFGSKAIKGGGGMIGCSMSMDQYREALLAYAEKNGGKLPPAAHWQDDVKSYLKHDATFDEPNQPFKLPGTEADYCDVQAGTSLVFNPALAGKKADSLKDDDTVVLYEAAGKGRNRSAAWTEASYESSPEFIMGQRRGWLRTSLHGEPEIRTKRGRKSRISQSGSGIVVEPD